MSVLKRFAAPGAAIAMALAALAAGCGGGGSGPEVDLPRIVNGPTSGGVSSAAATISWTTDRACDSRVNYGKTTSYTDSLVAGDLVNAHTLRITGLAESTRYHYRVTSRDQEGQAAVSGDFGFTTLSLAGQLVGEGWEAFETGAWEASLAKFQQARAASPNGVPALEGLGWALLRLYRLEESLGFLAQALAIQPSRADCLAAATLVGGALGRCGDTLTRGRQLLALAGDAYVFSHDQSVGAPDIRYCLVICLMAAGDLEGALAEAEAIDPSIDLDPGDRSTWGDHATFEDALLALVEDLGSRV
ncbi:MAG: fibronectin type III domain-containing protein [bacterium]